MKKKFKENLGNDPVFETMKNVSLLLLFKALLMVNKSANALVNDVIEIFEKEKKSLIFDLMDVETKTIFEKRMSWHLIREFEEAPQKVNHAIIEIATDSRVLSLAYNPASNFLSFSKDSGPVKFYSFTNKNKNMSSDRLISSEMYNEFKVIAERLLDL